MRKLLRFFLVAVSLSMAVFLFPGDSSISNTAEAGKKFTAQKNSEGYSENEAILKIDSPDKIADLAEKYNLLIYHLPSSKDDSNLYVAKSLDGISTKKMLKELGKDPDIELAQPNYKYKPLTRSSNDPYLSEQWSLSDTGGVSAFSAWDSETQNNQRNIAIAIIDTGANTEHKDLRKNLTKGNAKGKNFEHPKKKLTDSDGHGTFLAGIIAAQTNNRKGIAGSSFYNHLRVMSLRFDFTTSQAITAINYAKARNVPVVNASWGSYGEEGLDPALKDTIAAYPGVFVTASGNEGFDHDGTKADEKMYPCDFNLPNIICVAATDRDGNLTDYSDYGATSVDVAAPGGTDSSDIVGLDKKKNGITNAEGTSLSTAFVSAEAGLLLSKFPTLSSAQIIEIIKNSIDTNASLTGKVSTGGKVNFQKALQLGASY